MYNRKTAESVSLGHPDKVADYIADSILDAIIAKDKKARVACEVMVTTNTVVIAGEITTSAKIDYEKVARDAIKEIGYSKKTVGFKPDDLEFIIKIRSQSPDIALGVDKEDQGAGDQGVIFGYATNETKEYLPLAFVLSRKIIEKLRNVMLSGEIKEILPDAKSQITLSEDEKYATDIVLSVNHLECDVSKLRKDLTNKVIKKAIPKKLITKDTKIYINPTGRFVIGGPNSDCGVTGRKIIADTYGGFGKHGGGAFSGKDPSKLDRSGAYMARYIAKNIVASGFAKKCEVMLAYIIGYANPVTFRIKTTENSGKYTDSELAEIVKKKLDLRPKGITSYLDLLNPIYKKTTEKSHFFGDFSWEKLDLFKK